MENVSISEIAKFLKTDFYGRDQIINRPASLDNPNDSVLLFTKNKHMHELNYQCLILVPRNFEYSNNSRYSIIKVDNPRLAFAKVVSRFFAKLPPIEIKASTIISHTAEIGGLVSIGENCIIGNNVIIKNGTRINHNVIVADDVVIGENCYIKSGVIIGEDGFGFDFEDDGTPVRVPHLGSVIIGDNVEIGSNSVIARGTLNNTIIEDDVKIDDQAFIAHNCKIGRKTIITASAEISGSVTIGENCWIGPNSSIIQKIKIGSNVTIGIGAVVISDIPANKKIMGLEGMELRTLIKFKKNIIGNKQ